MIDTKRKGLSRLLVTLLVVSVAMATMVFMAPAPALASVEVECDAYCWWEWSGCCGAHVCPGYQFVASFWQQRCCWYDCRCDGPCCWISTNKCECDGNPECFYG